MLGFAVPAWLLALSALALPIALHLWSQRPRQVVRIGSLRHLRGPEGPRAWGRRLEDLPLLSLRLAIFLTVSLALAGLWWRGKAAGPGNAATIVLADPALVTDSLEFFADPVVDSLRRAGTPIHLLLPGMPRLGSGSSGSIAPVGGLWSRLVEADRAVATGADFLMIANPTAGELGGTRPALSRTVRWHAIEAGGTGPRVRARWRAGPDTTMGLWERRNGMVAHRYLNGSPGGIEASSAVQSPESVAGLWATLNGRSVSGIHLQVVADQRDTQEVLAAVAAFSAAIEAATGLAASVLLVGPDSAAARSDVTDLILWLSSQSVSGWVRDLAREGATLIEFSAAEGGNAEQLSLASVTGAGFPPAHRLLRLGPEPEGVPLLSDQFGRVVVSVAQSGTGRHYRIATRLGPAWSDLALGPALPELAYWIVTGQADPAAAAPVSATQTAPKVVSAGLSGGPPPRPLARTLLLLAGLLLLAERLVVHARQRRAPS